MLDFARTEEDRKILELKFSSYELGYPYMMAPETPRARVAALRAAFRAALADPELTSESAKQRLDVAPVDGAEIARILEAAYGAPPEVIRRYEELSQPPSQFETAKPVTVTAPLTAVESDGRRIRFDDNGKPSRAAIASQTQITVGGAKAPASSLKEGMMCAVTYFGDRGQAKAIACE